jgi:two-component system cell cycle sensor histidine kinase/response regulator CckA
VSNSLIDGMVLALRALGQGGALPACPPDAERVWAELSALEAARRSSSADHDALTERSRFLDSILEHLPHMIFVKDAKELRFQQLNVAAEQLLGQSRETLLGKNDHDVFPKSEADFFTQKDREVLARGELVEIPEEPIQTATGARWLSTKKIPLLDEDGRPLYLLGISQDITARRQAQQELALEQHRLSLLLAHLPGVMWTADAGLVVTTCAGAGAVDLGLDPATVVGTSVRDHPVIGGETGELLASALRGERVTAEVRHRGRLFEVWVELLGESPDESPGLIGVALDITERRRAEAERLQSRLERAHKLESLGLLAGGIAHDFNNLLGVILGNASLAAMKLEHNPPVHELLERVQTAAERAAGLTRQLLAYSGRGRFVVEPIDLSAVVSDIAELLRVSISKDVALRFEFATDLPPVEADVAQIRQLAMNLITNASDAMEGRPGVVSVSIGRVEADAATLADTWLNEVLPPGPYATLVVEDTGCGMDAATLEQMFDPFFSTKKSGHGLGLAAALGIVRSHRGVIRVNSTPGRGTAIEVLLPLATTALLRPTPEPPAATAGLASGVVLVVDDEDPVRAFAMRALRDAGFEVEGARDGVEALAQFERHGGRIRVVLLDLTMPRMGGQETLDALRQLDPDVRVLLSSGYSEQHATSRLVGLRSVEFLQKPYRAHVLVERVRELALQA